MDIDLGPVERITADAVGPPGHRTFFIQGRNGDRMVTVLLEKQQVQLLAASIVEILAQIGKPTGDGPSEDAMSLEEPLMPEWRVGRLAISYVEDRDLILLEAEELVPGAEGEEQEEGEEGEEESDAPGADTPLADDPFAADLEPRLGLEPGDETAERGTVRFWATREQMLALARHGAQVASQGRPTCRFCDQPMDAEGHVCPAMNGHRSAEASGEHGAAEPDDEDDGAGGEDDGDDGGGADEA